MSFKLKHNQSVSSASSKLRLNSVNKIFKLENTNCHKRKEKKLLKEASKIALVELLKTLRSEETEDILEVVSKNHLPDFKDFLSNQENVKEFRNFLKAQYSEENINFYLACEKFRHLNPEKVGKDLIKFMATQIFNDHLSETARHRVNINYDCLQNIVHQIKNPNPGLLLDAQKEIFDLMRTDCYPRFCKTWLLDRELAKKILSDSNKNSLLTPCTRRSSYNSTLISTNERNITRSSQKSSGSKTGDSLSYRKRTLETSSTTNSSSIVRTRGIKRRHISSSVSKCPPECPYNLIGLPCQQHNVDGENSFEQSGKSDLIDRIDLTRIHHVPSICSRRRTPPPPPLPPKPDNIELGATINKKRCIYVGRAFEV